MKERDDFTRPEALESDIERTRSELNSTLDAIQSKLTPGQLMDQAFGYARTSLPADFSKNLANSVRNNPVPMALVGIGLGWMMLAGQKTEGRNVHYARDFNDSTGDYGNDASTSSASGVMHKTSASVSEAGHRMAEKASDMRARVSNSASSMTARARDMASSSRGRMSELGQRSHAQYARAVDRYEHVRSEQPLMLGVLGVALGTLLGALLPSTRREDELMGPVRDDLMDSTKQTLSEKAETLRDSAGRVAKTAEEELERATASTSTSSPDGAARSSASGGPSPQSHSLH